MKKGKIIINDEIFARRLNYNLMRISKDYIWDVYIEKEKSNKDLLYEKGFNFETLGLENVDILLLDEIYLEDKNSKVKDKCLEFKPLFKGKMIYLVDNLEEESLENEPFKIYKFHNIHKMLGYINYIKTGEEVLSNEIIKRKITILDLENNDDSKNLILQTYKYLKNQYDCKVVIWDLRQFPIFNSIDIEEYLYLKMLYRLKEKKSFPLDLIINSGEFEYIKSPIYNKWNFENDFDIIQNFIRLAKEYDYEIVLFILGDRWSTDEIRLFKESDLIISLNNEKCKEVINKFKEDEGIEILKEFNINRDFKNQYIELENIEETEDNIINCLDEMNKTNDSNNINDFSYKQSNVNKSFIENRNFIEYKAFLNECLKDGDEM